MRHTHLRVSVLEHLHQIAILAAIRYRQVETTIVVARTNGADRLTSVIKVNFPIGDIPGSVMCHGEKAAMSEENDVSLGTAVDRLTTASEVFRMTVRGRTRDLCARRMGVAILRRLRAFFADCKKRKDEIRLMVSDGFKEHAVVRSKGDENLA